VRPARHSFDPLCTGRQAARGDFVVLRGSSARQAKRRRWRGRRLRSKRRERYEHQYSPALLLRAFFVQIAKSLAICCFRNHSSLQHNHRTDPPGSRTLSDQRSAAQDKRSAVVGGKRLFTIAESVSLRIRRRYQTGACVETVGRT